MTDPGSLAAGITVLVLFSVGIVGMVLTGVSRRRQQGQEECAEEGHSGTKIERVSSKPPQLPMFKTRSSLSVSSTTSNPQSPKIPKTPGIRFMVTAPSHRSRNSTSMDSFPSVETVLEGYDQDESATDKHGEGDESDSMLANSDLGEPGPSVPSEEVTPRRSAWDRPHIGKLAAKLYGEVISAGKT